MIEGEQLKERRESAIRLLLSVFNGDKERAIAAIKQSALSSAAANSFVTSDKIPTTPIILSAQNLTKEYKLGKQHLKVLNGVSFDIHEAEIIAIIWRYLIIFLNNCC